MIKKMIYALRKILKFSTNVGNVDVYQNTVQFVCADVAKKHDLAAAYIRAAMDDAEKIKGFHSRHKARVEVLDQVNKCYQETKDRLVRSDLRFEFNDVGKIFNASKIRIAKSSFQMLTNIRKIREVYLPNMEKADKEGRTDCALKYLRKAIYIVSNIRASEETRKELYTNIENALDKASPQLKLLLQNRSQAIAHKLTK